MSARTVVLVLGLIVDFVSTFFLTSTTPCFVSSPCNCNIATNFQLSDIVPLRKMPIDDAAKTIARFNCQRHSLADMDRLLVLNNSNSQVDGVELNFEFNQIQTIPRNVVLGVIVDFVSTFFLTSTTPCYALSPCSCNIETNFKFSDIVPLRKLPRDDMSQTASIARFNCQRRSLVDMNRPVVLNMSTIYVFVELNFEFNQIQTIPRNVSCRIGLDATILDITVFRLSNNLITFIEKDAFIGFKGLYVDLANNRLKTIQSGVFGTSNELFIDLRNNNFSNIPPALVETKVHMLRLEGNPIKAFDGNVIHSIASNASELFLVSLGLSHLSQWPHQIHLLQRVYAVALYDIPFYALSPDAFRGMAVWNLTIVNSNLATVPTSIADLPIEALKLENNLHFDDTLFQYWTAQMPAVKYLEISGSPGISFPDVFRFFPNITDLVLADNKLDFIDTRKIMMTQNLFSNNGGLMADLPYHVTRLSLDNNEFTRIPTALTTLATGLKILSMKSNKIETVEFFDLRYYRSLTELYLQGNPIKYITPYLYSVSLRVFRLDSTDLSTIPTCVQNLNGLVNFGISGLPIECSCTSLAHMKSWNSSTLAVFDGNCEYSSERLQTYFQKELKNCPDTQTVTFPDLRPAILQGSG